MVNFGVFLATAMAVGSPPAAYSNALPNVPSIDKPSAPPSSTAAVLKLAALPAPGTPVIVTLDQDLTATTNKVGDAFQVTVSQDVFDGTTLAIPKGTIGHGKVTFVTKKSSFGKPGIIGITLHDLELGEQTVALNGHYQEEGQNKSGTAVAAWFAVGVLSAPIKGKDGAIPKGRELKARTGLAINRIPPSTQIKVATHASNEAINITGEN